MIWDTHSFEDAACVSDTARQNYVKEVKDYLEKHPDEQFYFTGTGDCIVAGFSMDDGEVHVYETTVKASHTAHRAPVTAPVVMQGTRRGIR
mgnify:CR=1 FL=1